MKLPDRIEHGFSWGPLLIVAGILLWAAWEARQEYQGCFSMDDTLVLRVGHQGAAVLREGQVLDQTAIAKVTPIRGYMFELNEAFIPAGLADDQFFSNKDGAPEAVVSTKTIIVFQRGTNRATVPLSPDERIEYLPTACPDAGI